MIFLKIYLFFTMTKSITTFVKKWDSIHLRYGFQKVFSEINLHVQTHSDILYK